MSGLGGGLGQMTPPSGGGPIEIDIGDWTIDPKYLDILSSNSEFATHSGSTKETQTVTVTDIISEGPIEGLVGGTAGVYLNDAPVVAPGYGGTHHKDRTIIRLLNGKSRAGIIGYGDFYAFRADWSNSYYSKEQPDRVFFIRSDEGTQVKSVISAVNDQGGSYKGNFEWGLEATDNSSNWWQDSWILKGTEVTRKGVKGITISNYKPARLKKTDTGEIIEGHLEEIGSDHPVSGTENKRIIFRPGAFMLGTFHVNPNKYKEFKNGSTDYELFVDSVLTVTEFPAATKIADNSGTKSRAALQGFDVNSLLKEQDVTILPLWSGNRMVNLAVTAPSSNKLTALGHGFETGDEVIYTNRSTGTDYGGLTSWDGSDFTKGVYYIIKSNANSFYLATSRANAFKGTHITITDGTSAQGSTPHRFEKVTYAFTDLGEDISNQHTIRSMSNMAYANSFKPDVQIQFRSGRLQQDPFYDTTGSGATSITNEINEEINQSTDFGGDQAPLVLQGTSSSGFNLSSATIAEADTIAIRFNYAGGLKAVNGDGDDTKNFVSYQVKVQVKRNNDTDFGPVLQTITSDQTGKTSNATVSELKIPLAYFKPFIDFKVTISRETDGDKPAYTGRDGFNKLVRSKDNQNISRATISSVTTVFNEHQSYPLTSLGRVSFSSQSYGTVPKRSYHCRGMIVKVPSNYVTREESRSGTASYTRRSGIDSGVATDWDGTFRKAYTNNPAWVFYDIVTNNRYGLGDFVKETDIDKYSLYRIGRYCDELVPDGKGGTEPRYTLNTYLTKSTDAYKVLKDLATNFLSMIYYLNGKIFLVQDAPDSPTHSFSKANVIDGAFQYETTGSKTRTNQMQVIWNNPNNHYRPEPLIIEDKRNISETGQLITKEATAYGCTSEGQATRYGKWKLWTAINQNEIVSFKTGTEGAFISPGEIILVQDADRNASRLSGRVSGKLVDNLTESASYTGAIAGNATGFSSANRQQPVVFSGQAVLPSTFTNTAEVLFEHGHHIGQGTFLGMIEDGGTKKLLLRAGNGTAGTTTTTYHRIVKMIPIADIPEFDDRSHTITLELHPTGAVGNKGTARLWIDNRLVMDESTSSQAFQSNNWSSGNAGGWGTTNGEIAGYDSSTTPDVDDIQDWSGNTGTLKVYSNQVVSTYPTTTTISLDSSVTLESGSTYDLSIIYSKPASFNRSASAEYQVEAVLDLKTNNTSTFDTENDPIRRLIQVGMSASGSGIPADTTVTAVTDSGVTFSNAPTVAYSNVTITFSDGTYSEGDLVTHAYIDDDNDNTATFQVIDTAEKASNARGTPNAAEFLNLTFSEESRVETRPVSTSAGDVTSLTVSESFSDIPEPESIWVLNETNSEGFEVAGSGKKYKVLSITQEQNEQYSITAAEYYDEKYSAVEEEFTTFVQNSVLRRPTVEDEIPEPVDAWAQIVQNPVSTGSDTVIVHWTYARDKGVEVTQHDGTKTTETLFNTYRGGSTVEVRHNFDTIPSPTTVVGRQGGTPQIVFPAVEAGTYFVELRTLADNGRSSLGKRLVINVEEKLKRRDAGFFPEALHGGASSTKGTEIV